MPPETEVISCPACKHLLRVPADWLGTQVQCPECRAMFKAPVRDGDRLTEPELISRPESATAPRRGKLDAMLLIPAFGLLLLGVVSVVVNVITLAQIAQDPAGFQQKKQDEVEAVAKSIGQDPQNLGVAKFRWEYFTVGSVWSLLCGLIQFAGGLGIACRKWYRLGQVGCVAAALNIVGCCCVPGAVLGVCGLLMLRSEEGRGHFGR